MSFGGFLRANTAVDVLLGPFLDDSDGNTAETGLTISQADVRLSKNGQNMAQKNDANACTHDEIGYYNCPLDTTDTNTEGQLVISVHESGALAVRMDFQVLAEAAWDSLNAAKDSGFMDVNVKAVSEDEAAADNLELITEISNITSLGVEADGHVHADVKEVNGTAQTANDNAADINELVADDIPGLIAALNNLSAADVNAQVDQAIEDYHLDHLLAVTYDPASKPGAADALLNEIIESDAGVSRFTQNSLERVEDLTLSATISEEAIEDIAEAIDQAAFGTVVEDKLITYLPVFTGG